MDSMDSLNGKMDSRSKMEGDAKTSPEKVATAAIKANSSNRAERSDNRRQEKRREAMRNYSKNWYSYQSDEQKKEKAKKRKQRKQDKGKKEGDDINNKMTTEKVKHLTKIPDTVYKTIQKNRDESVSITTRRVATKKCNCATSGKTNCIENCRNANRTLWNKSDNECTTCPVECTPANCSFGEKIARIDWRK